MRVTLSTGTRGQCVRTQVLAPARPFLHNRASPRLTATAALFGGSKTKVQAPLYDISVKDIDNRDFKLSKYAGKVLLVCNVASACGFTPQYNGLTALSDKYSKQGLVVIGAPCNQFGAQEPGSNSDIKEFAKKRGAKFPLLAKLDVNGPSEAPLYTFLKAEQGGLLTSDVKWNFTKFLINRQGEVVGRYFSTTTPEEIEADVQKYL